MQLVKLLVFLIGLGTSLLMAQQSVSNEAVIEHLFFQALDSLKIEQAGSQLRFRFETLNDEKRAFCQGRLIKYFSRRARTDTAQSSDAALVIQQFDPQIKYFEPMKQLLGLGKRVKREVRVQLSLYLDGAPSVKNKNFWQLALVNTDQIDRTNIERLERSPFSFTHGRWVSFSRWTRFLQPAIIAGSVSVLIYLFYSLRT